MSGAPPDLSVLTATHNRSDLLRRCLDALAKQTLAPERFEVVIANDASSDGTAALLAELQTPFELRSLELSKGGQAAALNAAIEAARGRVCVFIDDDTIAAPGLLEEHLAMHERDERALGIGSLVQEPPRRHDWYARAFARSLVGHYEELETRAPRWNDCYGANFSAPREALLAIGGFSTDLPTGDDFDISYRLCEWGLRPAYAAGARVIHDDQKLRKRMLADSRQQGRAHVVIADRHPGAADELLDWTASAGPTELRLRRALLALRVPPAPLALLGALVPGEGRKVIWMLFVRRFAFWRSVRTCVDEQRWQAITGAPAGAAHLDAGVAP